jgi:hypothetical protein
MSFGILVPLLISPYAITMNIASIATPAGYSGIEVTTVKASQELVILPPMNELSMATAE